MAEILEKAVAALPGVMKTFQLFIAGDWVDSVSGRTFESVNPADRRDVIGRFQAGTAADVAMAVKAAEMGLPRWKATPAPKRGELLYAFAELMRDNKERLARAMTREMGKVLAEARGDVQEGIDIAYLVAGAGAEVGDAIVESPDVHVISFTGQSTTGKSIAERGARRLKRISLELGGKNGVVVMRDADLDLATDGILWSAFGTTGQRCTACSRVIVEKPVVEPLLERLESRAKELRLGSGLDETVDVGPLINPAAVEKVGSYID